MDRILARFVALSREYLWAFAYAAVIVFVNWLFKKVGGTWYANAAVGAGFVIRDLGQRDIGKRILLFTAAGVGLSFYMAKPDIAGPSAIAFGISEVADYVVVRLLERRPMWQRMAASHVVSVPVDTALFLGGLTVTLGCPWTWVGFWRMNGFKALALVAVAARRPR